MPISYFRSVSSSRSNSVVTADDLVRVVRRWHRLSEDPALDVPRRQPGHVRKIASQIGRESVDHAGSPLETRCKGFQTTSAATMYYLITPAGLVCPMN